MDRDEPAESEIVAMGVQVANLALGGLITVHPDRMGVEVELRRVLRDLEAG